MKQISILLRIMVNTRRNNFIYQNKSNLPLLQRFSSLASRVHVHALASFTVRLEKNHEVQKIQPADGGNQ